MHLPEASAGVYQINTLKGRVNAVSFGYALDAMSSADGTFWESCGNIGRGGLAERSRLVE